MKKIKCLICGEQLKIDNESLTSCPFCNSKLEYNLSLMKNKIENLKHEALMYIINNEYNKLLIFIDNNQGNLLLEYYRMYSFISLNKRYDKNIFYSMNLSYTNEELDLIILHMLEHKQLFSDEEILLLINKSENKLKYINILNCNKTNEYEKIKEKDIREALFLKTKVPNIKERDIEKEEIKAKIIISTILYIVFFLIVLIFTNKELKYYLFNLLTIIPCIILCGSLPKLFFKDTGLIIKILFFVVLLFVLTIPSLLFTKDYNIINHIIGLVRSPIDFFEILIEGMKPYEE